MEISVFERSAGGMNNSAGCYRSASKLVKYAAIFFDIPSDRGWVSETAIVEAPYPV